MLWSKVKVKDSFPLACVTIFWDIHGSTWHKSKILWLEHWKKTGEHRQDCLCWICSHYDFMLPHRLPVRASSFDQSTRLAQFDLTLPLLRCQPKKIKVQETANSASSYPFLTPKMELKIVFCWLFQKMCQIFQNFPKINSKNSSTFLCIQEIWWPIQENTRFGLYPDNPGTVGMDDNIFFL